MTAKRMPWFRLYSEVLDDPKVQRLPAHLFRTWVNLLCLANQRGGNLPSRDDIAFHLRLSVQDAEAQVSELVLAELIDIGPGGELSPHNWGSRQFVSDCSTDRVRNHRKRKTEQPRNDDETFHGTPPETDTDADTEQSRHPSKFDARAREKSGGMDEGDLAECKTAFNGSTERMLVEVEAAMGGNARKNAETWLANLLLTHGQDAVREGFQHLLTAKGENATIVHPLRYWDTASRNAKRHAGRSAAKPKKTAMDYLREMAAESRPS